MDIKRIVFGLFAAAAVLVGCEPKEVDYGVAKIEVSTSTLSFEASSSSQTLQVTATRDWTVSGAPDWVAVDPASGGPSLDPQNVTITVISNDGFDREVDLTFTIGLMKEYVKVSQKGQKGQVDNGDGTKEKPYSASAAVDYVGSLSADTEAGPVYVKGIVSSVSTTYEASGTYGNASFYISNDGSTIAPQFYVFQSLYLGNKKWTSGKPDIKAGDEVVVYGKVVNYKGNTPETVGKGGSYVYSLNGVTEGGSDEPAGDAKGTGTQTDPYNPAGAAAYAKSLGSDVQSTNSIYIKGKISDVSTSFASSGTYGNANFTIVDSEDGTGSFYIFQTYYLGNRKWQSGDTDVKVGDEVVVYGPVVNYKGNTPETVGKGASYIYSLNGQTEGGSSAETDHGATNIADFLAASESTADWYELTGVVSGLKDGDQYGNFDLTDDSGTVYVYGVLSTKGGEKKKFQELVEKYGIANGGTITIKANRGSYTDKEGNVKIEALNAYFVSYKAGGEVPPSGDEVDHGATTVAAFLAAGETTTDWYELTGVVSGLKDGDQYGNFDLTDDSGTVYVYGVLSTKGGEKKKFQELVEKYGIANGGTITIKANRGSYNDKDEAVNAYFVSYKPGEGGGEQTEDGYKISWSGQSDWNGVSDGAETISLKAGNYTITVSKEKGSTKPTVNGSSNDCRAYALNTVKVANSSADITSLTFVISNQGKKRLTDITASAGEVKIDKDNWKVTWTGFAKEVTFTVGEKATYGTDGDSKAGQFDFDYILAKPE